MTDKIFSSIGVVHFVRRKGCKKIIVKVKANAETYVTMPWLYPQKLAESFVSTNIEWIIKQQEKRRASVQHIIHSQEKFTHFRNLEVVHSIDNSFRFFINENTIKIITPQAIAIEDASIQTEIITKIESILLSEAKMYLPQRVAILASENGFSYSAVSISHAKTRWGCCNARKKITFSCFLMTLPSYLIDYVILHELCHTIHMNHSTEFYTLLNTCCGGKNDEYRKEMKKYSINVLPKFSKEDTLLFSNS